MSGAALSVPVEAIHLVGRGRHIPEELAEDLKIHLVLGERFGKQDSQARKIFSDDVSRVSLGVAGDDSLHGRSSRHSIERVG